MNDEYKDRMIENFNRLKPVFMKYHPFFEVITGQDMFDLIGKPEKTVIFAMQSFKEKYNLNKSLV